jgi:hypothetical protein
MAYETYRVEITRDETVATGGVKVEITAYIDRMPESHDYSVGSLSRAAHEVWSSRLQYAGDFESLGEALKAIEARFPETERIGCYEYTVDDEFAREVAPLVKAGGKWRPAEG